MPRSNRIERGDVRRSRPGWYQVVFLAAILVLWSTGIALLQLRTTDRSLFEKEPALSLDAVPASALAPAPAPAPLAPSVLSMFGTGLEGEVARLRETTALLESKVSSHSCLTIFTARDDLCHAPRAPLSANSSLVHLRDRYVNTVHKAVLRPAG